MKEIETAKDLYEVYGDEYPYACDLLAYYLFGVGHKDSCNTITRAHRKTYGHGFKDDESPGILAYTYGAAWQDYLEDIEDYTRNLEMGDGRKLHEIY